MRKIAFFLMLLLPVLGSCGLLKHKKKAKFTHMPLSRWREVQRMNLDSSIVAFKDTIRIEFLLKNKYIWQRTGGFIYKNSYTIDKNDIGFGMATLTVMLKRYNKLVLKDDQHLYFFNKDTSAHKLSDSVQIAHGQVVEKPKPVESIEPMVGHWSVYKRTADNVLDDVDYTHIIKMIDITGGSSDGKLGYMYAAKDPANNPSWYVKSYSNQILECDGKSKRSFNVIKCQDNEMILEEDGITYYFKQFK